MSAIDDGISIPAPPPRRNSVRDPAIGILYASCLGACLWVFLAWLRWMIGL